jgi:hypothetical protein
MLGCPGVHGHLLANQTLYLKHHCADRRHQGCQYAGPGTSVRRRFSGSSRTSRCLPVTKHLGCRARKAQWRIEILMPTKKRFLWCWRRRPLARPEVAASGALDRARTPTGIVASWAFAGLASNLPGPKTRAAICQTAAWQSRRRQHQKDSRRSPTGSRTEHGEPRSTRPGFSADWAR